MAKDYDKYDCGFCGAQQVIKHDVKDKTVVMTRLIISNVRVDRENRHGIFVEDDEPKEYLMCPRCRLARLSPFLLTAEDKP